MKQNLSKIDWEHLEKISYNSFKTASKLLTTVAVISMAGALCYLAIFLKGDWTEETIVNGFICLAVSLLLFAGSYFCKGAGEIGWYYDVMNTQLLKDRKEAE